MIILRNIEQRSDAWFAARLGVPTASEFSRIFTSQLKPSSQQNAYIYELVGELYGETKQFFSNADIERGQDFEGEAIKCYSEQSGIEIQSVGGVFKDESRKALVSPDGINETLKYWVEVKCVRVKTQLDRIEKGKVPTEYIPQILGGLWATGYKWWDFISYCPALPDSNKKKLWIKRVEHNEDDMQIVDRLR